ncbi:Palmitoyltransferase [Exophiala xenobiotica]|uniref:Palmitoyltransferase n=1 Tax=Lithohypha guttulata TaxID=1690604 RepID=A0ABR0K9D7_9EURO|nr:Palmitoyltransferase [Lithohypha guttulata]KAK5322127.1 Palmitoyltransferase [Exophiala xenobiotica]
MRFLFYAVVSMTYLEGLLYDRAAAVWQSRDLRYDLGPSVAQLITLFVLIIVNTLTLLLVGVTFFRALYALCCNVSTIESWEIERHEQLLRRSRVLGGFLDGPDGTRVRIMKQEFPYDIGVWRNICAGMGASNPFSWLLPFARTPSTDGLTFDTNGFEDPGTSWPPPDPDRMPRTQRGQEAMEAFTVQHLGLTNQEEVEAFRRRQEEDYRRRFGPEPVQRRKAFHKRYDSNASSNAEDGLEGYDEYSASGEEGWQDSDGNRLKDYGVDEDVEFYDEDDVPLAELLRRRQEKRSSD